MVSFHEVKFSLQILCFNDFCEYQQTWHLQLTSTSNCKNQEPAHVLCKIARNVWNEAEIYFYCFRFLSVFTRFAVLSPELRWQSFSSVGKWERKGSRRRCWQESWYCQWNALCWRMIAVIQNTLFVIEILNVLSWMNIEQLRSSFCLLVSGPESKVGERESETEIFV